jgi:hypothetical protein
MALALLANGASSSERRPLVGVHYFGGWYPGPFSHWMAAPLPSTHSWLPSFAERTPLLGLHTTNRSTIQAELAAAQAHGIDWFEMLWYDPAIVGSCAGGEWPVDANLKPCTNTPLAWMMNDSSVWPPAASAGGRFIRFSISMSNDLWKADEFVGAAGLARWLSYCDTWVDAMASRRYLKVDGRPVFKILGPYNFLARQCGGNTTLALSLIAQLRARALAAAVGDPLVGGGWIGETQRAPPAEHGRVIYQGIEIDYTGTYNSAGRSPSLGKCVKSGIILPFSQMAGYNDGALWGNHSGDAVPWVPNIDAGYDNRPAVGTNLSGQCTFGEPTPSEWEAYLRKVKKKLQSPRARLGFPLSSGGVQPAVTVYAWNEYAEGGIVAPTQGEGWKKLAGIAAVFGD